jgi:N,N'-diacetyllegionaminate synthase
MNHNVIIIAEAGVNHNGELEIAKKLIAAAADAGADYVKFQTYNTDKLVSKNAKKAEYQKANFNEGRDTQFEMLKKLQIPEYWYKELVNYCELLKIKFLSTGFDHDSIDFLDTLNIDYLKIPSGEITNKLFLEHIAKKSKPIIISTGMATLIEVKEAINVLMLNGISKKCITILHCNTEYPTPMLDVNLKAMITFKKEFGVNIGYSDHTVGIEVPIAAVALGAIVIEKHFTLDKNMPGPDHLASINPEELKSMVKSIRNIEKAISGSGIKEPSQSEYKNITIARKSLHYSCDLFFGDIIEKKHLIALRPGTGINPMHYENLIGKKLNKDVKKNVLIQLTDFDL